MMCPLCKTKYCSAACQKAHWPIHKPLCAEMAQTQDKYASAKARIKDREGDPTTRLLQAASLGRHSDCERIILEERPDLNWGAIPGFTSNCLYGAANGGHARVVALLHRHGARADVYDSQGLSPIISAAGKGHEMLVQTLLELGVEADQPSIIEPSITALMYAANEGHTSIVQILLNAGAVVDRPGPGGTTALFMAAQNGHVEMVRVLLRAGADPLQRTYKGNTPLDVASNKNHTAVVELLLESGIAADQPRPDGATALILAAQEGHVEVVRVLLRAGADPLHRAVNGATSLVAATLMFHTAVVELLRARIA